MLENWLVWEKHLNMVWPEMFCELVEVKEFFLSLCCRIDTRILINTIQIMVYSYTGTLCSNKDELNYT